MAIMDLVRDVTPVADFGVDPTAGTATAITCGECGMLGGYDIAPMSWAFARERGRVTHTCPECVRVSLEEIETFITR